MNNKQKPVKMVDPPRFPKVTNPIDKDFINTYKKAMKSMQTMIKVEFYEHINNKE